MTKRQNNAVQPAFTAVPRERGSRAALRAPSYRALQAYAYAVHSSQCRDACLACLPACLQPWLGRAFLYLSTYLVRKLKGASSRRWHGSGAARTVTLGETLGRACLSLSVVCLGSLSIQGDVGHAAPRQQ